jgi:cytoplasmic iron level regulating protein YaaA (DUF328/UPF0246 family)
MIRDPNPPEPALFIVLSPAKKLDTSPGPIGLPTSTPRFIDHTEELSRKTRKLSRNRLRNLMGISETLADLNFLRFQDFSLPLSEENSKPAIFTFVGDTYVGFDVSKLDEDDLGWAQGRLGLLSGFYGLLRPLDLMQPYRLEMGTRLPTRRGGNLYAFWGDLLGDHIEELLVDHSDATLVNLASNEYFKAVRAKKKGLRVVTPVFRDVKDGNSRSLFLFVKRARGAMARWAIKQRIERSEDLKEWSEDGYRFVPQLSDELTWIFERDQPPPVR